MIIDSVKAEIKVAYYHLPDLIPEAVIEYMNDDISTPYCLAVADDDFVCTEGIYRCVEFLENHCGYVAAHGKGVAFEISGHGAFGRVVRAGPYMQAIVTEETGSGRLLEFLDPIRAVAFSVHNAQVWKDMFGHLKSISGCKQNFMFGELLASSVCAIRGKVEELNCLYLVRQSHDKQNKYVDSYDWITDPEWSHYFQAFRECLTNEIVRQDQVSIEEAQDAFKKAFWFFLSRYIPEGHRVYNRSKSRDWIRGIPGSRRAWDMLRSWKSITHKGLHLNALLRKSSKYHEDFNPVYRAVRNLPK